MRALAALVALSLGACNFNPPKPDMDPPLPPAKPKAPAAVQSPGTIPGEDVLARRPPIPPLGPFDAPVPTVSTLPNGLKLYVVHRPSAGLEALAFVTRQGAAMDPLGKEGLASLSAAMLEAGSAGKSQAEVAAMADALGSNLSVHASSDALNIGLSALTPRLQEMSALLADVALRPNLDPKDWQKIQAQRLGELTAERNQPRFAARAAFLASLYGNGPLSHLPEGNLAAVKRMRLTDVKAFLASVTPADSAILAVGGASPADVRTAVEHAFGGWKASGAAALRRRPDAVAASRPRYVLVDFPSKPQSVLLVGQPAVPRSSPDHLALQLANAILGGSFTSRLNQNLREQHGYSYGAGSFFAFGKGPGPFAASTSVQTDVTGKAVVEVFSELNRLVSEPLSADELSKGKALLAFQVVEELQSVAATAQALGEMFVLDLPLDEFRTFVPRLQALNANDVLAAVRRTLDPAKMTLAVAGDARAVVPQLKAETTLKFPAPQLRDPEGQPVGHPLSAAAASGTSRTTPHP
jgi:zinc protease